MLSVMSDRASGPLERGRAWYLQWRGSVAGVRRELALAAVLVGGALLSPMANAFVAPAAGSFGFDIYDVVVNQILAGPIGFVAGVVLIVWGATQLMRSWMTTIMCVIAGTILIKAVTILTSLGAVV
jgi:hypothetical protein